MASKHALAIVSQNQIEQRIYALRGYRVMLDSDLAKLYGISTMVLNQAVKRNVERFPGDFAFQLTLQEFKNLISQFVISKTIHGGRRKMPWVFTEQGVAMLSSVLRSPTAIQVNIEIIRTFVRLRRLLATPGELLTQIMTLAETVQIHDEKLKVITDVLRKMMDQPADSTKPRFGFHPQ